MSPSPRRRPPEVDLVSRLPGVVARPMFGGYGIYRGGTFFAIYYHERLYFKTDDRTRPDFVRHGMRPFRPPRRTSLSRYYEVPPDVRKSPSKLAVWAARAVRAAAKPGTRRP